MPSRSPATAVGAFVDALQRSLSCVTDAVIVHSGTRPSSLPHTVTLSRNPAALEGDAGFGLRLAVRYLPEQATPHPQRWVVRVAGYEYALEDDDRREVVAYHWHPGQRSSVVWPHLHVGAGVQPARKDILQAHLPTRRVTVEEVLRCAIRDLGVQPQRPDWEAVLAASQEAHESQRTWA